MSLRDGITLITLSFKMQIVKSELPSERQAAN